MKKKKVSSSSSINSDDSIDNLEKTYFFDCTKLKAFYENKIILLPIFEIDNYLYIYRIYEPSIARHISWRTR